MRPIRLIRLISKIGMQAGRRGHSQATVYMRECERATEPDVGLDKAFSEGGVRDLLALCKD